MPIISAGARLAGMGAALRRTATAAALMAAAGAFAPALAQQRPADELSLVSSANVNTLNPTQTVTVSADLGVISNLYEALVRRGPDLKIQPSAAASWELHDGTRWRFKLKPDNKFANGEVLDAAAVKWNIEHVFDPANKARLRPLLLPVIDKVEVIDPLTLEITTKTPYLPFLEIIAHLFIMPPKWAAEPGRDLAREAMGTGPYQLKSITPGDRIVMEARPGFIGEPPSFKQVVVRVILEASSRVAALMSGEVDFIVDIPFTDVDRINGGNTGKATVIPSARTAFVHLNTLIPPFKDNVKLRQALNYAIDKKGIIDGLWKGSVPPSGCQVIAQNNFGYQKQMKPYEYSPQKAKQLLAEAGYPNGLTINLAIPTGRYLQGEEVTQIIAAQLEEVGVKANIMQSDFAGWLRKYVGQQMEMASYASLGNITLDADFIMTSISTGSYGYWRDDSFIDLMTKAREQPTAEKRMELYRQASERMCEQAPFVFLFEQPYIYATSNRVAWQVRNDEWLYAPDFRKR
jgi:peptide/nickel transport system substrate-binding protein